MQDSGRIIFETAREMELEPMLLTGYGLFKITKNGKDIYFFHGTSYLNSAIASYLARNKHATRKVLEVNNLPNIPYALPETHEEALSFLREHKVIMVKPTHGDNSIGVKQISSEEELAGLDLSDSIIEKFIDGTEYRTLFLDGEIIAFHKYIHDFKIKGVKRISYERDNWDKEMVEIALKAAKALGLGFASVDFIKAPDGKLYILEINSSTGLWRFHHPDEGPAVNVSKLLIESTIKNNS